MTRTGGGRSATLPGVVPLAGFVGLSVPTFAPRSRRASRSRGAALGARREGERGRLV
jgi:hypothetical protein